MNNGNNHHFWSANGQANGHANAAAHVNGPVNGVVDGGAQQLNIQWTGPALQQIQHMDDPRFGGDARGWHEERVTDYVHTNVPTANRVRIRKPVHGGGTNTGEPEHITISCLTNNRPLGTMHVYTADA